MSDPILGLSMLGLIVAAIMMGFPTAFTMMGLGMLFGFVAFWDPDKHWYANQIFDLMVQRTYGAMNNDTLLSIPLFVFMGYVIERAALVDKMFFSVQLAFRRVPASLAVTTLLVCAFWGIASGIVGAVVVLMGVIALRPMLKAGYDIRLASGAITAGGTLGILIPPSVMLIVYAAVAGQSIVKLYAAAMLPGFFLTFLYLVYIIGWALIDPKIAPKLPDDQYRIAVPDWLARFERGPAKRVFVSLLGAAFRPGSPEGVTADGRKATYGTVVGNLLAAMIPIFLTASLLGAAWWYVVIHNAPSADIAMPMTMQTSTEEAASGLAEPPSDEEAAEELGAAETEVTPELIRRLRRLRADDQRRQSPVGRPVAGLPLGRLTGHERVQVAIDQGLHDRMLGAERLQQHPPRGISPPGAPGHLVQQLHRTLPRPQVTARQPEVRIHHPHQRQMRKMPAFGDDLGADDQVHLPRLDGARRLGRRVGAGHGVARHDQKPSGGE